MSNEDMIEQRKVLERGAEIQGFYEMAILTGLEVSTLRSASYRNMPGFPKPIRKHKWAVWRTKDVIQFRKHRGSVPQEKLEQ